LNLTVNPFEKWSILNRPTLAMRHRFGPPAAEMGVMNYADARIEFQRATEAVLNAQRYKTKEQMREALNRYWLAQKQLRAAKGASIESQAPSQLAASSF
jgi:hypothetical protein